MKAMLLAGVAASVAAVLTFGSSAQAAPGDTLKAVKDRGVLNCPGHNGSYLGFAEVDDKGVWKGLDIDLCRALATAIFDDPDKIKVVPISWTQRWPALQSGDVDIIIKASGGTFSRDTELGFQFSNSYYLGTTKILAHKELGLTSLKDADGGSVCIPAGSAQERQVASYASRIGIKLETIAIEKTEELEDAYFSGRCDLYAQWGPVLGIARSVAANPEDHVLLPDVLAVEPEVMIVRQGDEQWLDIANWMLSVLLFAEQEGIDSTNVAEAKANPATPEIAKMLGVTPGFGTPLGLSDDWAFNVISKVGNYSQIFERGLGSQTPYKMPRELTALWNNGGVLFPFVID
ncbi:amino acid ABC transporter substrate-binding protein [Paracoccus shanxieyensis]|uniref:Transporter substrate-binding domain-containing protein n=1 Tax=Paracoccus shanxieyensis TaxID=2675752 RepID=A0A6L6IVA0_9RHOB|nr:amino acid ABC transporter substrate-binding protein [Paracoccus shanxieyensis]MTH64133.1 transporter substrate-binding domain-containing protein [Paracoccus shanxieyensis]MTH87277.1 transporter substrate-binding domain-containing protein [Paracoccus shanxieyensis]